MQRRILILTMLLSFLFVATVSEAATVGFQPITSTIAPGSSFSLNIVGQGFSTTDASAMLSGGTIDFSYNNSVIQVASVVVDPYWDFLPASGSNISPGYWSGIGFDVFANNPIGGDFTIATVTFTSLGLGISPLDILSTSQFFSATTRLTPTLDSASVQVTPVPLPAAAWLLLGGLAGIVRVGHRRKRVTGSGL